MLSPSNIDPYLPDWGSPSVTSTTLAHEPNHTEDSSQDLLVDSPKTRDGKGPVGNSIKHRRLDGTSLDTIHAKKSIQRPLCPEHLAIDPSALEKASDPQALKTLLSNLKNLSTDFAQAYYALNDELMKAQIEESVLKNLKNAIA